MKTPAARCASNSRPGLIAMLFAVPSMLLAAGLASLPGCETVQGMKQDLTPPPVEAHPAPITYKSEPEIRVRVVKGTAGKKVSGPAKIVVRQTGTTGKSKILKTPVTVNTGSAGIEVVEAGGAKHVWPHGCDIELMVSESDPLAPAAQSISIDGVKFPGFITIRPQWTDAPGRYDVVATMPIESYLPGVVTGELLPKWPRQTNEAQAVAARTYALHERARARAENRTADVENTTADQVYNPFTAQVSIDAVRATRGMVLMTEGKLMRAYFSSQCGGRPASAKDVWPDYPFNRAKPLQGQPRQAYCQKSPLYRWQVTRSDDDVNRRIRSWGKATQNDVADLGRLRSIEISDRNDADRPNAYKLTDDRGHSYILKAEELRMALNQPAGGLPPITKETRINSGDLEAEVWANQVRFTGRGWGHGVGMCQWCAKGMAEQGMDWTSMIRTFYPGVEIVKAY